MLSQVLLDSLIPPADLWCQDLREAFLGPCELSPSGHPAVPAAAHQPKAHLSAACQDTSRRMKYLLILLTGVDLINYTDFFMKPLLTSEAPC